MKSTMNAVMESPGLSPYSARRMAKPVNFYCPAAPGARQVNLAADFNAWDPSSLPMHRRPDGCWYLQVSLTHGYHQYVFLVDGEPTVDPHATGTIEVEPYGKASIVAVS
ncbi:MAG TPA: hypothetical protein VMA13_01910 [Candidatus Saccharimonadales bacterium]|nr:hypothetical protein [Candidatus Saccharimonadales bacterium]